MAGRLRRQYQTFLDMTGAGRIDVNPNNTAMEWIVYQVALTTKTFAPSCIGALYHNDSYVHSTPIGSLDSAAGPPYVIVDAGDVFTITWTNGAASDQATATIYYEEVPTGTGSVR